MRHDWQCRLDVAVAQLAGCASLRFAHSCGVVEFGDAVGVEERRSEYFRYFSFFDFKTRLHIVDAFACCQRNHRNIAVTSRHQRIFDECVVVAGAALTARLRDDDGCFVAPKLPALQGIDNAADHQRGRVTDVVVGVAQTCFGIGLVGHRQIDQSVARKLEYRR